MRLQPRGNGAELRRRRVALFRRLSHPGRHGLHQGQVREAALVSRQDPLVHHRLGHDLAVARPVEVHEPLTHVVDRQRVEGLQRARAVLGAAKERGAPAHGLDQLGAVHVVHGVALEGVVHGRRAPAVDKVRGETVAHEVRDCEEAALGCRDVQRVAVVVVLAPVVGARITPSASPPLLSRSLTQSTFSLYAN